MILLDQLKAVSDAAIIAKDKKDKILLVKWEKKFLKKLPRLLLKEAKRGKKSYEIEGWLCEEKREIVRKWCDDNKLRCSISGYSSYYFIYWN